MQGGLKNKCQGTNSNVCFRVCDNKQNLSEESVATCLLDYVIGKVAVITGLQNSSCELDYYQTFYAAWFGGQVTLLVQLISAAPDKSLNRVESECAV